MTEDEVRAKLEQLPHRAIVAFAVRCARRVLHLYERRDNNDPAVHSAVEATERWVMGFADGNDPPGLIVNKAVRAAETVGDAKAARAAGWTAASAAWTVAHSAGRLEAAVQSAVEAAAWSSSAAGAGSVWGTDDARNAAWNAAEADLCRLADLRLDHPFNPSEFGPLGPLWPNDEPWRHRDEVGRPACEAPTHFGRPQASNGAGYDLAPSTERIPDC